MFLNISLSFALNSSWKASDYSNLLSVAASQMTYVETIRMPALPSADSFHRNISEIRPSVLHENFRLMARNMLKKSGKAILIIDETHEPFYGKKKDVWIHDYRPEKGCTGSYKFLCASILSGKKRFFVDAIPLHVLSDKNKELHSMLSYLKGFIDIEVVLLDRGFYSAKNIEILEKLRLKYLMLVPNTSGLEPLMRRTRTYQKYKYFVNGKQETRVVIKKEEKIDWIFATNLERCFSYIRLYKKRWNIETGFRVCDEARIKTKSLNIATRYFLFLSGMLFYNAWKILCSEPLKRILFKASLGIMIEKYFLSLMPLSQYRH